MWVYSLMAPTKSDIREVLLSISCNRLAISSEAAILTRAARAVSPIKVREQRFDHLRLDVSTRQTSRQKPQVVLSMTAQQRINLVFQVADGQSIRRNHILLRKRSFQSFDFCFLRRSEITSSQFETRILDLLQNVAQLAGGTFRSRSRIVKFMRESCRKLSQRSQSIALLFEAGGFADPVGHQAHETLGELRHFLHKLGKFRRRKS